MPIKDIESYIRRSLTDLRYRHTLGVAQTSVKLAGIYGVDNAKAEIAALIHDIARDFSNELLLEMCLKYSIEPDETEKAVPALLHGRVGAKIAAEKFNITDGEILDPVKYHTTGRKNMTIPDKILFLADMIEPGRDFPGVTELRELAFQDLDRALLKGLNSAIKYVIEKDLTIHMASIDARNDLIRKKFGISNILKEQRC
ncbi:bis(5'-nucleosyl)-tetraphosphatase (symmetrical) YqeK [Phosphitispora sp. TUW77]|uniref:bis(5'-nucleosyl)-tetraphosphatase (symmetrical) YqeK n=1 Tax=Phosphitispora sp. TUW77 TaxID=3152361 RepID=UPI003AB6A662